MKSIIRKGVCECIFEPEGRGGLEGFVKGMDYTFEFVTTYSARQYYRVYHSDDYYETCGLYIFSQHFKIQSWT